jgi:hypothetical protein
MGLIFSAHEKNTDAWNLRLVLRLGKRAKREEHSAKSEREDFGST